MTDLGADGAVLLAAVAQAVAPPTDETICQWSEGRIVIPAEANTAKPGPLSWEGFEYCMEPLERLHYDDPCRKVTIRAAGQTGKSNIGVVWFGWTVCVAPRPMGLAVPSGPKASSFNTKKLQPVIDKTPDLDARINGPKSRAGGSTILVKTYPGGSLTIISAGSVNDLQSESFGAIWITESPNFAAELAGRGSPLTQIRTRMDGWEARGTKELHESTPGEEGACPVSADFDAGDQRLFYMDCPHCDSAHRWEWEDFVVPEDGTDAPYIVAPCCGSLIYESELPAMKRAGRYLPTFPSADPANPPPARFVPRAEVQRYRDRPTEGREPSYAFWQILSPLKTWRGLAQDWRDARGKPAEEASFRQQKLGLPTESAAKAPDHLTLVAAAQQLGHPRGQVPAGCCYLTGAADIQGDRIEWAIYAHGPLYYARIDRGVIEKDPLTIEAWAELARVVARRWEGPSVRPLGLDAFGVDSGGVDGVTPRVYEFVRGRPNVYAIKGASAPFTSTLPTEFKRIKGKDTKERTITIEKLGVDGYIIKRFVTYGLQALVKSAEIGAAQPGAILFEDDASEEDFKQLTAEVFRRPVGAKVGQRGEWARVQGRANEQLDLAVYNWALAYQKRIHTWDQPRWEQEFARRARTDNVPVPPLEALWDEPMPVAALAANPSARRSLFSGRRHL